MARLHLPSSNEIGKRGERARDQRGKVEGGESRARSTGPQGTENGEARTENRQQTTDGCKDGQTHRR